MAAYDGLSTPSLMAFYGEHWNYTPVPLPTPVPTLAWMPALSAGTGALTAHDPEEFVQAYDGIGLQSVQRYYFYDKIYTRPARFDLGAVAADQTRQVSIWNAYLEEKTLISVNGAGTEGMSFTLDGSLPYEFGPLAFTIADIDIAASEGPFIIDASYTLTFTGEIKTVDLTGMRAQVWGFGHNWDTPLEETLEYKTVVRVARAGIEHRAALRKIPRRGVSFSLFEEDDALREMETKSFGWQARTFLVPLRQYPSYTTGQALSGTDIVPVETADRGLVQGAYVLLENPVTGAVTPSTIESVGPSSITLEYNLAETLPEGSRVFPAHTAWAGEQLDMTWQLLDFATGNVTFEFLPVDTWAGAEDVAPPATYRDEELFETEPDWVNGLATNSVQSFATMESPAGRKKRYETWIRPSREYKFGWLLRGHDEIARFREFLQRRLGRAVSFWAPSFRADIRLHAPVISIAATAIHIVDSGYLAFSAGNNERKNIRIQLNDGTVLRRRVNAASYVSAGVTALALDAALGVTFTPDDIFRISFLSRYRLGSDTIKLAWYSAHVVTVDLSLVTVPDYPEQDAES